MTEKYKQTTCCYKNCNKKWHVVGATYFQGFLFDFIVCKEHAKLLESIKDQ